MAEFQQSNSFSWGDALFLYIERPGQPLSIGCVSIFEGTIPLKGCRDFVESKLPLIPRYLQHVVFPPFNLGLPLWDLTLVRGLEGNRTGLIVRIHHCLADGVAGVGVINVLMDPSPVPPPIPSKQPVFHAPPARDAGAVLIESLVKSYFSAVSGALTLGSEL